MGHVKWPPLAPFWPKFFTGYGNGRREISLLVPSSAPYADLPALMAACGPFLPCRYPAATAAIGR
jgi:hypothetical protein